MKNTFANKRMDERMITKEKNSGEIAEINFKMILLTQYFVN